MAANYSHEFQLYLLEPTIQQYAKTLVEQHHLTQEDAIAYIHQQFQDRKLQQQQQQQQAMINNRNNPNNQTKNGYNDFKCCSSGSTFNCVCAKII